MAMNTAPSTVCKHSFAVNLKKLAVQHQTTCACSFCSHCWSTEQAWLIQAEHADTDSTACLCPEMAQNST